MPYNNTDIFWSRYSEVFIRDINYLMFSDESRKRAIIKKIPLLILPTPYSSKKKSFRPSKAESAEAFICTVAVSIFLLVYRL